MVGFLNSGFFRFVVAPVLAAVLTTILRKFCNRHAGPSYKLIDKEFFAIGFDLMIMAVFSGLASMAERAKVVISVQSQVQALQAKAHLLTQSHHSLAAAHALAAESMLSQSQSHETSRLLDIAVVVLGITFASFITSNYVSRLGFQGTVTGADEATVASDTPDELSWRRGVIYPLAGGVASILLVAVVSSGG